ncbi:MAG: sensor domain-containing diguanylate cyclase [Nitrospinota bacterium]|nr:sensor domain-containing diguanylate cyclase [Nitrospinota bacterium]
MVGESMELGLEVSSRLNRFFERLSINLKIDSVKNTERAVLMMKYYEYDLAIWLASETRGEDVSQFVKSLDESENRIPLIFIAPNESAGNWEAAGRVGAGSLFTRETLDGMPKVVDEAILEYRSGVEKYDAMKDLLKSAQELKEVNDEIVHQSSKILRNKKEEEEERRKLEILLDFSQGIFILNLDRLIETLKERLPSIFGVELFSIFTLDENRLKLLASNHPQSGTSIKSEVLLEDSPLMKEALDSGKPVLVNDFAHSRFKTESRAKYRDNFAISIPILMDGKPIGVLNMNGNREGFFDHPDITFIHLGVDILASAISNAMQHNRLEELSITDGQTGLYNNRYFYRVLSAEWEKSRRYDRHFSLIIADIDFFKKVNDTYGHLSGDLILKEFADVLVSKVRKADTVARYGGEEFIIVLPESDKSDAALMAERMRKEIEASTFKGCDNADIKITSSFGVADSRMLGLKRGEDVLKMADNRLYIAKNGGRNMVVTSDKESP